MKCCLHCSGQNRDQARFCGHCGSPFSPLAMEPSASIAGVAHGKTGSRIEPRKGARASFRTGVIVGVLLLALGQVVWREMVSALTKPSELEDRIENRRAAAERYQAVEKLEERFAEEVRAQAKEMPTGLHEMIFTRITQ